MLTVELHKPFHSSLFSTSKYTDAINHLASNTVVKHKGAALRPRGSEEPSFDFSETCCWVCEKPLRNSMNMCTRSSSNDNIISIIDESSSSEFIEENPLHVPISSAGKVDDLLLLCDDCIDSLQMMGDVDMPILYPDTGELIDSVNDRFPIIDSLKKRREKEYYIWPNDQDVGYGYAPSECFNYVLKSVFVISPTIKSEDDMEEDDEYETKVEYGVFVEPNPELPTDLFRKALNTIRLFRLNGKYYQYGKDVHMIFYPDSASSFADDLRLSGRNKSYKRARTALHQFKSIKGSYGEAEMTKILTSQQKILMELNGYRSVWSTVFDEGGNPDDFNGILGPVAPLVPVSPITNRPKSSDNPVKKGGWNLNNPNEDLPVYKKKRDIKTDRKEAENKLKDIRTRLLSNGRRISMSPDVNKVVPATEDNARFDEFWEWYKRTYGVETQKRRFTDVISPYVHDSNDFQMPIATN